MCAISALPVASITTFARTTPRVPSGITITTPVTFARPSASAPSHTTPSTCEPKNTWASPFETTVRRIHSAFACAYTQPVDATPESSLCLVKPRL